MERRKVPVYTDEWSQGTYPGTDNLHYLEGIDYHLFIYTRFLSTG